MRINGKGAHGYNAHGQTVRRNVGLRDKVDDCKKRLQMNEIYRKRDVKAEVVDRPFPMIEVVIIRTMLWAT